MAIQLGTVAAIGFDEFPPQQWLAAMRQLGCTVVQAYRNPGRDVSLQEMRDALDAGSMHCDSLHGIFGEQYDPSCPSEEARQFAVDTYKAEGDVCLSLGGSLVVVHCSTIRHDGIPLQERALRVEQLKKSIAELGAHGLSIGVQYAFENLPSYHPVGWDVAELARILQSAKAPSTGLCFDCGHANMVGDVVAAIKHAAGQMIYVHLNDNSGKSDDHMMLTYGTINAEAMAWAFKEVRYSGTMMLEVFYSTDRLKQLLDEGCGQRLAQILAIANG